MGVRGTSKSNPFKPAASHGKGGVTMLLLGWTLAASSVAAQSILYVDGDAGGAGTGLTWCDAYNHLQDALSAAQAAGGAVNEIRVAEGVYKPDAGTGQIALSRSATFQLQNGLTLRGGYAGCGAPNPNARNLDAYPTVLTGDLAGDDIGDRFHASHHENAYHVVTGSGTDATAVLDGFTVTAGHANGAGAHSDGGGLYNDGGSPTIVNCIFTQNYALRYGGAIRNWRSSSPTITDCRIIDNSGDYGGGVNNTTQSHPVITRCEIARNTCGYHGGGVYNDFSSAPQLIDCTIADNRAYYNGGGVANYNQSHAVVTGCRFERNESATSVGGGMLNSQSSPTVTDCLFEENRAVFSGGAVSSTGGAPEFLHTTFRANHANNAGGMINDSADTLVHNVLFVDNTAGIDGAAMYNLGNGTGTIRNSTFVGNIAGRLGGGMFNFSNDPVIHDSIFWNNADRDGSGETAQINGGAPVVDHSFVQGWTGVMSGVANYGLDPRFTAGPLGCYYLRQHDAGSSVQSPCVDAGGDVSVALGLEVRTTRVDSVPDTGVVDVGYHYPVGGDACGPGNYVCHHRIDLRDFAGLQRCFGGSGGSCCEQFDVDGQTGLTLEDYAVLATALSSP